jgi:hypothetical protein
MLLETVANNMSTRIYQRFVSHDPTARGNHVLLYIIWNAKQLLH